MPNLLIRKSFTLAEIMMAVMVTVILVVGLFNYNTICQMAYSLGVSGLSLQDGAHTILARMTQGSPEPGGSYSLQQGVSYCVGSGINCATVNTGELHFWGMDGIERWYRLNTARNVVEYYHPTAAFPLGDYETLYVAPPGAAMTLFFWIPSGSVNPSATVGMNISLAQTVAGKTVSGFAQTQVNLRNHP